MPNVECRVALLCVAVMCAACRKAEEPPVPPGEDYAVFAALSTEEIRIGDPVLLTVTAYHPPGTVVQVPDPGRDKAIVLRGREAPTGSAAGEHVRSLFEFHITSFELGEHAVSTGAVRFADAEGVTAEHPFPDTRLRVVSVLTDGDDGLRDIKPPRAWPDPFPRWLWAVIVVPVLALVAALLAARYLRQPQPVAPRKPATPPERVALEALQRLLNRQWIEEENIEPFFVELSSIVRRYLEDRFHLRAPERTTEEFIREAATSQLLSSEHQALVSRFLEQCDLVKFARYRPGQADMRHAFTAAERLVMETARKERTES